MQEYKLVGLGVGVLSKSVSKFVLLAEYMFV
jgi:hypothetical protein